MRKIRQGWLAILLAALLLFAAAAGGEETAAAAQDRSITLIAVTNPEGAQAEAQLLSALRCLYPDYLQVRLHVIRVTGGVRTEAYSGPLSGYTPVSDAHETAQQDGTSGDSLETLLARAGAENTRLLLFPGAGQNPPELLGLASLAELPAPCVVFCPLAQPGQTLQAQASQGVANATEETPRNAAGEQVTLVWLREDASLLQAAQAGYEALEGGRFPQIIRVAEAGSSYDLSELAATENQRITRIIVKGTGTGSTDNPSFPRLPSPDGLSLYGDCKAQSGQTLYLGEGLHELLICQILEPYRLEAALGAAEPCSNTDRPVLTLSLTLTDPEHSAFFGEDQTWSLEAGVGDHPAGTGTCGGTDTAGLALDLTPLGTGEWPVTVTAANAACPDLVYRWTAVLQVQNDAPALRAEHPDTRLSWWLDTPVAPDADRQGVTFNLTDFFADDAGEGNLRFTAASDPADWYSLADGLLTFAPEKMPREQALSLTLQAEDSAGQAGEPLTFTVTARSVAGQLTADALGISAPVTERVAGVDVTLRLPESLADYLARLTTEQQAAFWDALRVSVTLDGVPMTVTPGDVPAPQGLERSYSAGSSDPLATGDHTLAAGLALGEREPVTRQETIRVENKVPGLKGDALREVSLVIPGPLFLQADVPVQEREKTFPLDQLIQPEVLDVITVKPAEGGMGLFRDGDTGRYLLTDEEAPAGSWQRAEAIAWDTGNGEAAAPTLTIRRTRYGSASQTFTVTDQDKGSPESTLRFDITSLYRNDSALRLALWIAIGLAAALIITAVVLRILKPAFGGADKLQVSYGDYKRTLSLESWKKDGLSLADVLIYTGVPFAGELPPKAGKLMLTSGGRKCPLVIRGAVKCGIRVTKDGAEQDRNRILLEAGSKAEVFLDGNSSVVLTVAE